MVSETTIRLPSLDMSQPLHSSCSLSSLAEACREWGFFQITNHGISKDVYRKIHSFSGELFRLPLETKLKLGPSSVLKTYTPCFIASPFFESLRVSGPDFTASAQASVDVLLPATTKMIEFGEKLQEYGKKVSEISKGILKLVLMSLELGDEFLTKYYEADFKNCHGYLRINNYSPPENKLEEEETEGLGMHTDMSCITIVYQDEIGGLQVKSREGKWMDILPCEGSLVVNVGDMLQAWSNDNFRSSEHRVVLKKKQSVSRFSLAFFWCFKDEKVVVAPEEVVGKGNPRKYNPFVCLDYLRFRENHEKGKFEKVGFTVKDFAQIAL